jgi:hypothetical protein
LTKKCQYFCLIFRRKYFFKIITSGSISSEIHKICYVYICQCLRVSSLFFEHRNMFDCVHSFDVCTSHTQSNLGKCDYAFPWQEHALKSHLKKY